MSRAKQALQIAVILGGLVPVGAGLMGVLMGPKMAGSSETTGLGAVPLDSHFRYLSGLLLGIGFGFWSMVPHIERCGRRFRLLAGIVVIGGLGRLASLFTVGVPDKPMVFGLGMELLVTPLLALWQYRISKTARKL